MTKNNEVILFDHAGKPLVVESRNLAFSKIIETKMPQPQFNAWTVEKAVKEGMAQSVWVYRADTMIADAASDVLLKAMNKDGEFMEDHPVSQLLRNPNPQISRKEMMRLIYLWLMLAGIAYNLRMTKGKKKGNDNPQSNVDNNNILWPVSPDRIGPVPSKELDAMILGYTKKNKNRKKNDPTIDFKTDEIIAFRIVDPSNPLLGLSPLMAAGKIVDTDNAMQDFNKSAMDNKGVIEGIVSFKQEMSSVQLQTQAEAWKERHAGTRNAKTTAFLGSEATYKRTSMTPEEADFESSRKSYRDAILSAHGTPPQLVGAQESSTLDNLRVSEVIFWRGMVIPVINITADSYTFFFRQSGELREDETIQGDFSDVSALQQNFKNKTNSAEKLWKSGVPMKEVNRLLKLGMKEYEGWDKPFNGKDVQISAAGNVVAGNNEPDNKKSDNDTITIRDNSPKLIRQGRDEDLEGHFEEQEKFSISKADDVESVLLVTQADVKEILNGNSVVKDIESYFTNEERETKIDMEKVIGNIYLTSGIEFGKEIIFDNRSFEDDLAEAIAQSLDEIIKEEAIIIDTVTRDTIISQVIDGLENGLSVDEIKLALVDTGVFSADRALRIARTVTGTGASIGQLAAAELSGGKIKIWRDSNFNVRELHQARDGEEAPIDGEFTKHASDNGVFPRFPLDPRLSSNDRVNCRCSMTFR